MQELYKVNECTKL